MTPCPSIRLTAKAEWKGAAHLAWTLRPDPAKVKGPMIPARANYTKASMSGGGIDVSSVVRATLFGMFVGPLPYLSSSVLSIETLCNIVSLSLLSLSSGLAGVSNASGVFVFICCRAIPF